MEWKDFLQWGVQILITGIVGYGVKLLSEMSKSMHAIDNRLTLMSEKLVWHEKSLDRYEARISRVETSTKNCQSGKRGTNYVD